MKKVIMIGDSITEYMPYVLVPGSRCSYGNVMEKSALPESEYSYVICGVENIGVGNFHKYGWGRMDKDNVFCYVMLLGINNLFRPDCDYDGRETLEDTVEKIKDFAEDVICSGGRLIIQGLYPTDSDDVNRQVKVVNKSLEEFADSVGCVFLDLYDVLCDENGRMSDVYSRDGIHPNKTGYLVIMSEVEKTLNKIDEKHKTIIKE